MLKKSHFMKIGGKDITDFIRTNLKTVLSDEAASQFSLHGLNNNIRIMDFNFIKYLKGRYIDFSVE